MTLIAVLVLIGGLGGMIAVEIATVNARPSVLFISRFAVGLPVLGALVLIGNEMGGFAWPVLVFAVLQPSWYRRWLVNGVQLEGPSAVTR